MSGIAAAYLPVYFAYSGWYAALFVGGEVRDPARFVWSLQISVALRPDDEGTEFEVDARLVSSPLASILAPWLSLRAEALLQRTVREFRSRVEAQAKERRRRVPKSARRPRPASFRPEREALAALTAAV